MATRDGQNDYFPGTSSFSSVHYNDSFIWFVRFDSFVTSDYILKKIKNKKTFFYIYNFFFNWSWVRIGPSRPQSAVWRCLLYSMSNVPPIFIPLAYSLYFIHGFTFIILFYFTFNSSLFRHYRTFMVINKKYELQFNFFVCSWIDVEWSKDSWDWEMRLSNKQMEVKSIFEKM